MGGEVDINYDMIKAISAIPLKLRKGPFMECLKSYGKALGNRSSHFASSRQSGSRKRWSKKYANDPKWAGIDSRDYVGSKVTRNGLAIYWGAKHWKGNKQQFLAPYKKGTSYTRYLWGQPGQQVLRTSRRGNQYYATVNTKPQTASYPMSERGAVKHFYANMSSAELAFIAELQKQLKALDVEIQAMGKRTRRSSKGD
jgi:hypothetical protein